MEIQLGVGAELTVVDVGIDIQKSDVEGGSVPNEVDGIVTVDLFQESSKGSGPCGQGPK